MLRSRAALVFASMTALASCAGGTGQVGVQAAGSTQAGYVAALNRMRQICVETGPDFSNAPAVIASMGGRRIGQGSNGAEYQLPDGAYVQLARRPNTNQCSYFRNGPETLDDITRALSAQPGFQRHPAVELIAQPAGPPIRFPSTYRVPAKGVYVTVQPSPSGSIDLTIYIVQKETPGALNVARNGQLAVVEVADQ